MDSTETPDPLVPTEVVYIGQVRLTGGGIGGGFLLAERFEAVSPGVGVDSIIRACSPYNKARTLVVGAVYEIPAIVEGDSLPRLRLKDARFRRRSKHALVPALEIADRVISEEKRTATMERKFRDNPTALGEIEKLSEIVRALPVRERIRAARTLAEMIVNGALS